MKQAKTTTMQSKRSIARILPSKLSVSKQIIKLDQRSYPIFYGDNILNYLGKFLNTCSSNKKLLFVSDTNVNSLYRKTVENSLKTTGYHVNWSIIRPGEQAKTLKTVSRLYDKAATHKINKNSTIIALGGGVVQDLANFVSATYLRGINFVQIPTTLLSQSDIGLGGCALDHTKAKSLIGSFYQPKLVITDINVLKTLPETEIANGIAEIINKVMCLGGKKLKSIEKEVSMMKLKDPTVLKKYILSSNKIKKQIIEKDETGTKGTRQILDFGHTITHALERISQYRMSHGRALGIGMYVEAVLSHQKGYLEKDKVERLKNIIELAGLPTAIPRKTDIKSLIQLIQYDQKTINGKTKFILLRDFGKPVISEHIDTFTISNCLRSL